MPHLSYDLDGDGYVSQADYRTAAQFDLDKGVTQDGQPDDNTGLSPREQTEARLLLGRTYRQQLVTANAPTGGHGGEHASLARRNLPNPNPNLNPNP